MAFLQRYLLALLAIFFHARIVKASDVCQPSTWNDKRDLGLLASPTFEPSTPSSTQHAIEKRASTLAAGTMMCRNWAVTGPTVNYYTCYQIFTLYSITMTQFQSYNPGLLSDCSNIKPNTQYCVQATYQPKFNANGTCGPSYGNASCAIDGSNGCCNSVTWTCGGNTTDCERGTCWGGLCPGYKVYTIDGLCGYNHEQRLCAGKWGNCCSLDGKCGTGDDFCGIGKCQSGNCTQTAQPTSSGTPIKRTPDGSCGGTNGYSCVPGWGKCCSSNNTCSSFSQDCATSNGCQPSFGSCS